MFSVKHATKNGDTINEAKNVNFCRAGSLMPHGKLERDTVYFQSPDELTCSIDSGDVYVMNSAGNNVSVYRLMDSPTSQ